MKKEIMIQIFTGGYQENDVTYQKIREKLMPILETGGVKAVIMGWSLHMDLYEKTIELLKNYQVKCFLWLPVFSETGLVKPVKLLLDDQGHEVRSFRLKAGENFEFYCPREEQNAQSFLQLYEESFQAIAFDGVFLDKIRYGAFSNGLSGVFNCFCPKCQPLYEACGIDTDELQREMKKVREGSEGYDGMPLNITGYKNGEYEFRNEIWKQFFQKKRDDITNVLSTMIAYFHEKNMIVGLDTFSPFTAYFAGQDIKRLGSMADFIKPMMYRITNAPAGLPFEAACLLQETTKNDEKTKADFYQMIGCRELAGEPFDLDFVKRELKQLTEFGLSVYAGVEINRNEAAMADRAYIRENLKELETSDMDGFVLSWDLLSAPAENIAVIIKYLQERRETNGTDT